MGKVEAEELPGCFLKTQENPGTVTFFCELNTNSDVDIMVNVWKKKTHRERKLKQKLLEEQQDTKLTGIIPLILLLDLAKLLFPG